MVWSTDPVKQKEMSFYIEGILEIEDKADRHTHALTMISYGSSEGYPTDCLGTMALAALYPQGYKK